MRETLDRTPARMPGKPKWIAGLPFSRATLSVAKSKRKAKREGRDEARDIKY